MKGKYLHALIIGIGTTIVLVLVYFFGFLESWQLQLADNLFLAGAPHPDIAIIAIDDPSIQSIGRWPWDRVVHAKLLSILGDKPAAIGIDVAFPEPSTTEDDAVLENALAKSTQDVIPIEASSISPQGNTVLVRNYLLPIRQFAQVSEAGVVNMVTDPDGITRLSPITMKIENGERFENFSIKILREYHESRGEAFQDKIPSEEGLLRINFAGGPKTFPTYPYVDVLSGTVDADVFTGKIVLIGSTALDLHDNMLTPVSSGVPMSGVEVHANVIQTILDQKFLYRESNLVTIASLTLLAAGASILFAHFGIAGGTVLLFILLAGYTGYAIISFDAGTIRNLVFPPLGVIVVYVAQVIYKYFVENKQKRFIRKALSYYLSESVMREVLGNPKKLSLGGERKEITVLFSDIAGFTSISEKLQPETLAQVLNQYLTRMTKIVFTEVGVLDKYIGDAVMAFWGAPLTQKEHAMMACKAAIRMQEEIAKIQDDWKKLDIERFDVRIGINTGEMVVGNMGSDLRFDYTLLGDNVNLGSRLEGINKEYGTHIIISAATYEQVKDQVIARRLDTVAVKGKAKGVTIYELRGLGTPTEEEQGFLGTFEKARTLYHDGKFKHALAAFIDMEKHFPHDEPTKVYIKRCKELSDHPPADWDGVYHAKTK